MNPRLRLDTTSHLGAHQSQRFSILETPREMSPPNHPGSPQPPTVQNQNPYLTAPQRPETQTGGVQGPNDQQHPAYAPYVNSDTLHQAGTDHDGQPVDQPSSPGPLPVKTDPNAPTDEHRKEEIPIVPDTNPLQSPTIPYFSPPEKPSPAGPDLATYHRPGQVSHPNQDIKGGGWSYGLCDCSSIGTCCLGLLCPCILYGRTQHRLSQRSRKADPTNMLGYETCNASCTAMALLCGCQWLLATIQHTRTRKAYAIQGNIASDCVRATCCTCCTLIQDEKEIRKREEERAKAARAAGASLVSPYLTPVPMSYGPPT
ncbi:PLAC8 family-domain-containing protein [Aspergillus egyptiacus]|nr:PLAC8 family-domain-containing protein [Aspergillus egyptiacus]